MRLVTWLYPLRLCKVSQQRVDGDNFIWADESKDTDIYLGIGTNLACVMSSQNPPLRRKFWSHVPMQPRKASPRSPCCKDKVSASEPSSTPLLCLHDSPLPSWAFWWDSWVSPCWACSKIQQIRVCRTSLCGRQKTSPHIARDVWAANLRHEIWPTEVLVVMVELYPIGRFMSWRDVSVDKAHAAQMWGSELRFPKPVWSWAGNYVLVMPVWLRQGGS